MVMHKKENQTGRLLNTGGFTLVEMMVVVAIMTIIMGVVFFNSRDFANNANITNQAYKIALSVREAQVYGLSVRGYQDISSGSAIFNMGYGVSFDTSSASGKNTSYSIFVDKDKNHEYGLGDEIFETDPLEVGNTIYKICTTKAGMGSGFSFDCSSSRADISFLRPNPEAYFKADGRNDFDSVVVVVKTPTGKMKQVEVYSTGQIAVEDADPRIPNL